MELKLSGGFNFSDLHSHSGLARLDAAFCAYLKGENTDCFNRLMEARQSPDRLTRLQESELILELSPALEAYVARLFGIEREVEALRAAHSALSPLYDCKRNFIQRRAAKKYKPEEAADVGADLAAHLPENWTELDFANAVMQWLKDEAANADKIALAEKYVAFALYHPAGKAKHKKGVLFKQPRKIDPMHLVPVETEVKGGVTMLKLPAHDLRARDGFGLTDKGCDLSFALDQANYCIWCHKQGKDSCSTGLRPKNADEGKFQKSAHGIPLAGCPLEEKISEMNQAKAQGNILGALAIVTIDNPMAAATGHRICNDCMKSCIYQKQEPVDIPQVETRALKEILNLPWGVEIYSLLTRWNPLNIRRPLPKADTGRKILVVGAGPAGFTLAHHLMNDGHGVVMVDGLKIEPWQLPFAPVRDFASLIENLDERMVAGFGGVAEYGITVRWDKNFLKLIRLLLERREKFRLYGGVRFGGTLTVEQAFNMGFDHIALCAGAGKPTILDIPNALARGVRAASDFLMALQLTGAAKEDSLANLQIRLPVVVIGGGLTAVDTATESLAYYARQVEKFARRYGALVQKMGADKVRQSWTKEEAQIAEEYLGHAAALKGAGQMDRLKLLQQWGGATIAYRRKFTESPSYSLNHEEVHLAMEEGIYFAEGLTPLRIETDSFGHASAIVCKNAEGGEITLPAKTILYAAGTQPNVTLASEDPKHIVLDGKYFQAIDSDGEDVSPEKSAKPDAANVLMHRSVDGRFISFFGDMHPSFAGNVVKAMASAKRGYPVISGVLEKTAHASSDETFFAHTDDVFRATVHAVKRLTPKIIEVVVRAPMAAHNFEPGQFYRLQNYETHAAKIPGTVFAMEGLAMTGASVDKERGLLSTIVLEMGGSSSLCQYLKPGEPVVLMGPTGTPTEIPKGENILLIGGGLGNAVLFSIGQAMRANGCDVTYFAGYKNKEDVFKPQEIEKAADRVVWCCDSAELSPRRNQDSAFKGNMIEALLAHKESFKNIDRIICIGSDRLMDAVNKARQSVLKPYLKSGHIAIGSINSPMQCMMKEICAQCLQLHRDPATGREKIVFSCVNQDQLLDEVDFAFLHERLLQNGLQEKLTALWITDAAENLGLTSAA